MKASELLNKYAQGERNFQRVNLRGQSFKGKDLSGAVEGVGIFAGVFAAAVGSIAWRAIKGDKRDAILRSFSVAFAFIVDRSFALTELTNFVSKRSLTNY